METEPVYTVNPNFSGVGFYLPGSEIPSDETPIPAENVDPKIRARGREWFANNWRANLTNP